jgi:hypothetical protein
LPPPVCHGLRKLATSPPAQAGALACADRYEAQLYAFRLRRRTQSVVAVAVRLVNLTVANALYAYAVTGSAFATVMMLPAPHLEVFARCLFHGKG